MKAVMIHEFGGPEVLQVEEIEKTGSKGEGSIDKSPCFQSESGRRKINSERLAI